MLKKLSIQFAVVVLVGLGLGLEVSAEHGSPWFSLWPGRDVPIPTNGRVVVISANGPSDIVFEPLELSLVDEDGENRPIALAFELLSVGVDGRGYGNSVGVFDSAETLSPETFYTILIDGTPEDRASQGPYGSRPVELRFGVSIGVGPDTEPPVWLGPPSLDLAADYDERVRLNAPVTDDGGYVLVGLDTCDEGEVVSTMLAPLAVGECWDIYFGDGTYEHAHQLDNMAQVRSVRLFAEDVAGNRTEAPMDACFDIKVGGLEYSAVVCR